MRTIVQLALAATTLAALFACSQPSFSLEWAGEEGDVRMRAAIDEDC